MIALDGCCRWSIIAISVTFYMNENDVLCLFGFLLYQNVQLGLYGPLLSRPVSRGNCVSPLFAPEIANTLKHVCVAI